MLSQVEADSVPRRLLPQQMVIMQQTINLSGADLNGPRENQRNYVFVDEHNRHKRLKVMRACEGCRRRKIKCDAATTNTWPCSACVRLKLQCVPPMVQYDRDFGAGQGIMGHDPLPVEFEGSGGSDEGDLLNHNGISGMRKQNRSMAGYQRPTNGYHAVSPQDGHHDQMHTAQMPYVSPSAADSIEPSLSSAHYQSPPVYPQLSPDVMRPQTQQWSSENDYTAQMVGQLRIDDTGVASYISAQNRRLAETPAYEPWQELEPDNPSFLPGQHEFAVRIQEEDMPHEAEAGEMFNIYFNHCHPYLPIVHKSAFLRQWRSKSRQQISPLLLEAIFGCAGRLLTQPAKGLKWIALASKHVDCFMDVPRLSTVQALLILMKARESAPQRGYFFRSWMSIVSIITMARDLGLETHHKLHQQGLECGDDLQDCMTRTRVWQACFSYELMISAPQGRERMAVDPDTVDLTIPMRMPELEMDEQEFGIHRNYVHLVGLVKHIRRMVDVHNQLKTNPTWRNDPQFLNGAPSLDQWQYNLPPELHVQISTDLNDPPPQLDSHFAGNLQVYFHLAKTMLHRPALAYGKTYASGGEWRHHMSMCTTSAKSICRLEEVIFEQYGMLGFQCMSRGVNFSIYTLLTGAMIHLIAATCPDPEFNHDAREYFTRTMRLLENCIDNSASQEVKGQIQALREAFSVDLSRPFVLNPSFPFYHGMHPSVDPGVARGAYTQAETVQTTLAGSGPGHYGTQPISPPHSSASDDTHSKADSPAAVQSLVMMSAAEGGLPQQHEQIQWNPSRLFDNWNAAFGASSSTASVPTPAIDHSGGMGNSLGGGHPPSSSACVGLPGSFVSPGMWQDSVATAVFSDTSHKRSFPFANEDNGWGDHQPPSSSHSGNGLRTPTTPAHVGTGLHVDSSPHSRTH